MTWVQTLNEWIWGPPLVILLFAVGCLLTYRTRGVQFRYLYYAHKLAFTRHDDHAQGDISHFQALMTALAGTIGIGSIAGVATGIVIGGYGALFWMWVVGIIGMATKFSEALLAIKYRVVDEAGEMCGGPMEYLERGAGKKVLAVLFAFFAAVAAFGTGNMVQANSVALAMQAVSGIDPIWIGLVLTGLVGFALFGGIKSIGRVASILVPTMAIMYILGGIILLLMNYSEIPHAFYLIFKYAFTPQAATGGFAGASVLLAVQMGASRSIFSSESGLGTSPIAAAAAKTDTPGRQALVSMSSAFITIIIVCTITGLAIGVSGVLGQFGPDGNPLNGAALALKAFDTLFPGGGIFVTIALVAFAYSTILAWAYYGEKCVEYLFGIRAIKPFRVLYTLVVLPGALFSLNFVWGMANIMNGLMILPNLIGLLLLSKIVARETKVFDLLHKKEL
ncbi:MAG: sodium:alanine symporter family protein [Chlamydiales bacterium]